jgi:hypothetical protein
VFEGNALKKAQDDLLHLQRGKAPLNPFKMGMRASVINSRKLRQTRVKKGSRG